MRIEKYKLLQIVKESKQEIDEMAAGKNPEYRALFDAEGNLVGHRMVTNLDEFEMVRNKQGKLVKKYTGPAVNVLFACQEDVKGFMDTHQELIQRIKEKEFPEGDEYLEKDLVFTNVGCPMYRPHQRKWVDDAQTIPRKFYDENGNEIDITTRRYQVSGEQLSLQESINRKLKDVLFEKLMMDSDLERHLTDCSIPFFKIRERRYEDRHNIANNNNKIHYGSDVFNLYETANDFLSFVLNNSVGLESDVNKKETHLARLRNKLNRTWDPRKKNELKYFGLTPKYYLEAKGFTEKNYDVNIFSKFDIVGERHGNQFLWLFKLKVTYGKKIPIETLIKSQNVKTFKEVVTRKDVVFNGDVDETNSKNNILTNPEVLNGLLEGLHEFKAELMSISTDDALEMANYFQFEVGNEIDEMNETFNRLIKSVLKESGMRKTVRIKESDLVKLLSESIIKNILEQENFDDFITKTKENREKYDNDQQQQADLERDQNDGEGNDEGMKDQVRLTLATDESGKFYILKNAESANPEIVAVTN